MSVYSSLSAVPLRSYALYHRFLFHNLDLVIEGDRRRPVNPNWRENQACNSGFWLAAAIGKQAKISTADGYGRDR